MNELILATYIQILQEGLVENDKQETAGRLLLNSVALQSEALVTTDLGAKKICRVYSCSLCNQWKPGKEQMQAG